MLVKWNVSVKESMKKQQEKLPKKVAEEFRTLVLEMERLGPLRHNWKSFGKLKGSDTLYHCHIKTGRPTYVVCWKVKDKKIQIIEVYYVGTHEKAPY